jgi:hypothetical protein
MLFHLVYLCVPSSEWANLICKDHYNQVEGHFGIKNIVAVLQKHFARQNFDMMSASISGPILPALLPNQPLRNKACTHLFLLLTGCGIPSQWTTFWAFHPPSGEMTMFLWLLIAFTRMGIMVACKKSITVEATIKFFFE